MGSGIVPYNVDRSHLMLVHRGRQEIGDLLSSFVAFHKDEIFSALIGDGPDAVVPDWPDWCRDLHLLSHRTPLGM
jgi:hypothetical protein